MRKVEFYGWDVGAKKISFTKLLRDKGNLTLKDAKNVNTRIMNGNENVVLEFEEESVAKLIVEESTNLGFKCRLID
ncbi:MAG: hypothetical protein CL666_01325 [Balneola sp.]|nr:hypothetical protein [Balneola sp.]|tara:strand:- start:27786 stop:28013 length:228 start_codon:yes stop_codon:yes gene_type:complete